MFYLDKNDATSNKIWSQIGQQIFRCISDSLL